MGCKGVQVGTGGMQGGAGGCNRNAGGCKMDSSFALSIGAYDPISKPIILASIRCLSIVHISFRKF